MNKIDTQNQNIFNLELKQVGYEVCKKSHYYGPAVRQYYLIHFVRKGKGRFLYNEKEIEIYANEMFLIFPDEVTYYQADSYDPWEYYWFGFLGESSDFFIRSMGFDEEHRKIKYNLSAEYSVRNTIVNMSERKILTQSDNVYNTAKLYEILSWLIKNQENKCTDYTTYDTPFFNAAIEYINRSYMLNITIEDIAKHIGVERTQIYRYFKKNLGKSPKEYLIEFRMLEAKKLILNTKLSIKQISYSVGYYDQYLFSKMFKKRFGLSPKNFRYYS